jgi:hypothetical protein
MPNRGKKPSKLPHDADFWFKVVGAISALIAALSQTSKFWL